MTSDNKKFDQILTEIGGFGRFQFRATVAVFSVMIGHTFLSSNMSLLELIPKYQYKLDDIWKDCDPKEFCGTEIERRVNWASPFSLKNLSIQLELECQDTLHIGLIGSTLFIGNVLALLVVPTAADRLGRK